MTNDRVRISKRELLEYQADVKSSIFRQIRERFALLKKKGFTQKDLALKIGMNEGQLSRRLRGDYDLRLETLSDLARGLDCRIDVRLAPLSGVAHLSVDAEIFTAAEQHKPSMEPPKWERYRETRHETLKEWPKMVAKSSFGFERLPCKERSDLSWLRKRSIRPSRAAIFSPKKAPVDTKLYALFKTIGASR
jgi:transcriptional regulator with XRE-family HTH domain